MKTPSKKSLKKPEPINQIEPLVGKNGHLYFNFAVGATYLCEQIVHLTLGKIADQDNESNEPAHGRAKELKAPQFKQFTYTVTNCFYDNGEYYTIARDGTPLNAVYSAARLKYLIDLSAIEIIDDGERQELPLLPKEVIQFYAAKAREVKAAQSKTKKELKALAEYAEFDKSRTEKITALAEAVACGENAEAAEKELSSVLKSINELAAQKGITLSPLFTEPEFICPYCNGTGITPYGQPCECALNIAEEIKAYCAARRLEKIFAAKVV